MDMAFIKVQRVPGCAAAKVRVIDQQEYLHESLRYLTTAQPDASLPQAYDLYQKLVTGEVVAYPAEEEADAEAR